MFISHFTDTSCQIYSLIPRPPCPAFTGQLRSGNEATIEWVTASTKINAGVRRHGYEAIEDSHIIGVTNSHEVHGHLVLCLA